MNRFLFVFGYEEPFEERLNREEGTDFESSHAIWVRASCEEEALSKGRAFADSFVARVHAGRKVPQKGLWSQLQFANWICGDPSAQFPGADLTNLEEI